MALNFEKKQIRRWNKCFIHDKVMPEYIYITINFVMYILDIWYYFLLMLLRLNSKKQEKKYYFSICAIFKNESLSLKEWIEYHRLIGIDHFYLYNNNSTDNGIELLKPYIESGLVSLIDWKYPPPCQAEAYNDFKEKYWNETSWVAFIDLDEYICLKRDFQIKDWLKRYENYPSLIIYWKMFGSSGIIDHDSSKLITEQYFLAWDKFNDIGKPFFNTRFKSVDTTIKYIHSLPAEFNVLGVKLQVPPINEFKYFIKYKSNRIGLLRKPDDFTIQLNHYATKSYLEFFVKRKKRGDVNGFKNNTSVKLYKYVQNYSIKPDYTIYRYLTFLKVRLNKSITNYFDD